MEAKLILFYGFIITELLLGIVECEPSINQKINHWFMKVEEYPTEIQKISELYSEYCGFFDTVTHMKNEKDKLTCEVQLVFIPSWLFLKAEIDVKEKFRGSIKKQKHTLLDNFKNGFGVDPKVSKFETAFEDYYTNERKNEISKLLEKNKADVKQAMKFAFELVYFANMQFIQDKTEFKFSDLIRALEDISNMKKKFPQSSDFFDALSFYLRSIAIYEFYINEAIDEWFKKIDGPTEIQKISELYSEYCVFFDIVSHMKNGEEKQTCEVQLLFIPSWLLLKAEKDVKFIGSIKKQQHTLFDNLKKGFGVDPKVSKFETAFEDYYTNERKTEIFIFLEKNTADIKQAKKFAFELVYFADIQFIHDETKFKFSDLIRALEIISNMKKKFPQSSDFFDALSFYLRSIVVFEFNVTEKIDEWFMKVDTPTGIHTISELYSEYNEFFFMVDCIKDEIDKLTCEIQLEFGGYWFLRRVKKNGEEKIADLLYKQLWILYDYFHTGNKIQKKSKTVHEAFNVYYTDERKLEISKLLKEKTTDLKQAKKGFNLAVTLVYTACLQFIWGVIPLDMTELKCLLDDINNMRNKFTQSRDLFDELSFFLCLIYSDLIVNSQIEDDFKDDITESVMEYPVEMPDNNITVDLTTIIQSKNHNPYTKMSFENTKLELHNDLLKRIKEWKIKTLKSHNIKRINSLECILID